MVEPRELVVAEKPLVDPLPADRVDQRVEQHEADAGRLDRPCGPPAQARDVGRVHVVVARAHQRGTGPAVEPGARFGVLLGQAVVRDVTAEEEDVGRWVHGQQVVHDRGGTGGRVLHGVAEVGVAHVGDDDHAVTLSRA